jgi:hypothetical protein
MFLKEITKKEHNDEKHTPFSDSTCQNEINHQGRDRVLA